MTVLTKACIWGPNLGKAGRGDVLEKVMCGKFSPMLLLLPVTSYQGQGTQHHQLLQVGKHVAGKLEP